MWEMFNKDEAFWLPKGSIRALLALTVVGGVTYLCLVTQNIEILSGLAGAGIGFYFSKKDSESTSNGG